MAVETNGEVMSKKVNQTAYYIILSDKVLSNNNNNNNNNNKLYVLLPNKTLTPVWLCLALDPLSAFL